MVYCTQQHNIPHPEWVCKKTCTCHSLSQQDQGSSWQLRHFSSGAWMQNMRSCGCAYVFWQWALMLTLSSERCQRSDIYNMCILSSWVQTTMYSTQHCTSAPYVCTKCCQVNKLEMNTAMLTLTTIRERPIKRCDLGVVLRPRPLALDHFKTACYSTVLSIYACPIALEQADSGSS